MLFWCKKGNQPQATVIIYQHLGCLPTGYLIYIIALSYMFIHLSDPSSINWTIKNEYQFDKFESFLTGVGGCRYARDPTWYKQASIALFLVTFFVLMAVITLVIIGAKVIQSRSEVPSAKRVSARNVEIASMLGKQDSLKQIRKRLFWCQHFSTLWTFYHFIMMPWFIGNNSPIFNSVFLVVDCPICLKQPGICQVFN